MRIEGYRRNAGAERGDCVLDFSEDITVYHGSYIAIPEIDLEECNYGLDFGRGFYVTTSFEQAVSFVPNSVKKNKRTGKIPEDFDVNDGQISVYRLRCDNALQFLFFPEANLDWLHYIASNRDKSLFREYYDRFAKCDVVVGKIADDNTSRVLAGYVAGLFGTPGSELADSFAIQSLLPNRLKDQLCFKTEASIRSLEFVRSCRYGDVAK